MTAIVPPNDAVAPTATWPEGEILRDISRAGLAGLPVGLVVAGIGGRVVMRLAALLVPGATGAFTENGNRVGEITLGGSIGLIVFVGLIAAILFGVIWVAISPWLPGSGLVKGLFAAPVAVALGAFALIDGENNDFFLLRHDATVVAILVVLVALVGPAMGVLDAWLDRRLPHATSRNEPAGFAYLVLTIVGVAIGSLLALQTLTGPSSLPLGITILGTGAVTIAWWRERLAGRAQPSRPLVLTGRAILTVMTVVGFAVLTPDLLEVLGRR